MDIGAHIESYRIDALIGQGGMASVYRVHHMVLRRDEALKLLAPHMTYDRVFVDRFLAEARTAAALKHPNIAVLYSISPPDTDVPYFTMELMQEGNLAEYLKSRNRLTLSEALPLLRQIASGLDYAHSRRVIHCDVKPANVLLETDTKGRLQTKIVDFGIARALDMGEPGLTKVGMIIGTPDYISPEQGGSVADVTPRSDQYSLAVIAFEMLCGRLPFGSIKDTSPIAVVISHVKEAPPNPAELAPDLPSSAVSALLRAMSKMPEDRFDTCSQFVTALVGQPQPSPSLYFKSEAPVVEVPRQVPVVQPKRSNTVYIAGGFGTNMTLVGYDTPLCNCGPIAPICEHNQILYAILSEGSRNTTSILEGSNYISIDEIQAQRLGPLSYDYARERLFLFPDGTIEKYKIEDEHKYFEQLLLGRSFEDVDCFLRLSLAKATKLRGRILPELRRCISLIASKSPSLLTQWYSSQRKSLLYLPKDWEKLSVVRSEPYDTVMRNIRRSSEQLRSLFNKLEGSQPP